MPITTGVFPVSNNIFKVGTNGTSSTLSQMVTVKDMETFQISVDGKAEEWNPMDQAGWIRRLITSKGLTVSLKGKRNYGDTGNDYVAGLLLATGQAASTVFQWTLSNQDFLQMNAVIDLKSPAGGDSTNIDSLEFDVLSDGKPTYTPGLIFACANGTTTGKTKIATAGVTPAITAGNTYKYQIATSAATAALAVSGTSTASGWTAYTLNADITASIGNYVILAEVDATGYVVKCGMSLAAPL